MPGNNTSANQGNPINPANNIELLQQGASNDIVQRYSNLNSINPFKGTNC